MRYPFLLYSETIDHRPVFTGLQGDPYVADLSPASPLLAGIEVRDQKRFQQILDEKMAAAACNWGFAPYLERRDTLLGECPQMAAEERFIHLGLDVIVDLGAPLHAPLDSRVAESGYEAGEGNYGGFVLLEHAGRSFETFYSFYGHLSRDHLPAVGSRFPAGQVFSRIGDFYENGNWFYHTHIQVITARGLAEGYLSKGYCTRSDLVAMDGLCPSPMPLFKRS